MSTPEHSPSATAGTASPPTEPPTEEGARRSVRRRRGKAAVVLGLVAMVAGVVPIAGLAGAPPSSGSPRLGQEAPATGMDLSLGPANNSPLLLADPTDARFVVAATRRDAPDFSCALQVSGDRGRNWLPAEPVPTLPEGADKCYGPEVAFDSNGVLYYLFVGLAGGGNEPMGIFLTSSSDRGRSFSTPRQILPALHFGVRMAIDPAVGRSGRMHLVWLRATSDPGVGAFGPPPNPIYAAHSDDGGRTFSEPIQVSDPARERVVAPGLTLGPNRRVHISYYDLQNDARDYQNLAGPVWEGTWSVLVTTSTDGGRSFAPSAAVDEEVVPFERPMLIFTMPPPVLAAHDQFGLCAAWPDGRHGDADVVLRCSRDDGRRWGPLRRVNDDRVANGKRQYLPRLAAAPGGRLEVVFYDRREDPANVLNHVYYTYSRDGGRRFARNLRISTEPSDTRVGPQYAGASAEGQYEIGSRLGLLARSSSSLAAWADTRNSRRNTTNQDVFVREVRFTAPSSRARPLGLLLLGAGALAVLVGLARRRATPSP